MKRALLYILIAALLGSCVWGGQTSQSASSDTLSAEACTIYQDTLIADGFMHITPAWVMKQLPGARIVKDTINNRHNPSVVDTGLYIMTPQDTFRFYVAQHALFLVYFSTLSPQFEMGKGVRVGALRKEIPFLNGIPQGCRQVILRPREGMGRNVQLWFSEGGEISWIMCKYPVD